MRGMGITVDFAPVVDVSDQGDDTVIGDRSFSNDPATVTAYAGAFARGLRDAGVLPVQRMLADRVEPEDDLTHQVGARVGVRDAHEF